MKDNVYETNLNSYEAKFQKGYGIHYPESHVIRVYEHVLKYELGMKGGKILDYGCGSGTHLKYFMDNGFIPYGCDISKSAIEICRKLMPKYADNFKVIPCVPDLKEYFNEEFDLVLSNQVLYYMKDEDIKKLIRQFQSMTKAGGVLFVTIISRSNYLARYATIEVDGLTKIESKGRLDDTTFINFKDRDELPELFKPFRKLHIGFYGASIREDDGPSDHYIFLGQKVS